MVGANLGSSTATKKDLAPEYSITKLEWKVASTQLEFKNTRKKKYKQTWRINAKCSYRYNSSVSFFCLFRSTVLLRLAARKLTPSDSLARHLAFWPLSPNSLEEIASIYHLLLSQRQILVFIR